jgi:hypothetical protein
MLCNGLAIVIHTGKEITMRTLSNLSIIAILAVSVAVAVASCSKSEHAWEKAKESNTIEAYSAYEQAYPDSPHAREAAEAVASLEIKSLEASVMAFLSGNKEKNTISSLNGSSFKGKDQASSSGITVIGTVAASFRNIDTGKVIEIVYDTEPGQEVGKIVSIRAQDGVIIILTNGHKYEYAQEKWNRKG